MRLAVIIVNYRTPDLVLDCLDTLVPQLVSGQDVAVVVDNGSGDDSIDRMREGCEEREFDERVRLVDAGRNAGFSAGNNTGIESVEADFYLLLNSDTLVRDGAVERLLRAADEWPEAGILSPRLEWKDGEPQVSCFRDRNPGAELIHSARTGVVTRLLCSCDVPMPIRDETHTAEWTSFACVLIRSEVFEQIGLMDESYFMYFEDIDFCRRARDAGYEIRNIPAAHVVHLRGGTSSVKSSAKALRRLPAYYYRSRTRYFAKFYGRVGLVWTNACWLAGRLISWLREVAMGKPKHLCEREFFDLWIGAGRPLAVAPEVEATRGAPSPKVVWVGSSQREDASPVEACTSVHTGTVGSE